MSFTSIRQSRADRFRAANEQSPIVYGSVTGPEENPTGVVYRLANGQRFELTSEECQLVEPRWAIPAAA